MKKNVTTASARTETLEELLAAAGFSFTVVDRCPEPTCRLCGESKLSAAA